MEERARMFAGNASISVYNAETVREREGLRVSRLMWCELLPVRAGSKHRKIRTSTARGLQAESIEKKG